jgi:hypothetical protein
MDVAFAHPCGVEPSGNSLFSTVRPCRTPGLGALARLPDELLLEVLGYVDAAALCQVGATSRALHAYANVDDVWRTLCLTTLEARAFETWGVDWKTTLVRAVSGRATWSYTLLRAPGLFSDLLFKQHIVAAVPPDAPDWTRFDNCPREDGLALTRDAFVAKYERPNSPVLLTGCASSWPALSKWSDAFLVDALGSALVHVAGYDLPLRAYLQYCAGITAANPPREETPLYLFDKEFARKAPSLALDYTPPSVFGIDLFAACGEGRPDYRWLILGPKRSGSVFHKDPNGSSAWNCVVRGAKKWILWPPDVAPPGVHASADGSQVATPMSVLEWMTDYYSLAAGQRDAMWRAGAGKPGFLGPVECVCRPGEVLFVPRGWWHAVVNLEDGVALTHNFVSDVGAMHAFAFLRRMPYAISGVPEEAVADFADLWKGALQAVAPAVAAEMDAWDARAEEQRTGGWAAVLGATPGAPAGGFTLSSSWVAPVGL